VSPLVFSSLGGGVKNPIRPVKSKPTVNEVGISHIKEILLSKWNHVSPKAIKRLTAVDKAKPSFTETLPTCRKRMPAKNSTARGPKNR